MAMKTCRMVRSAWESLMERKLQKSRTPNLFMRSLFRGTAMTDPNLACFSRFLKYIHSWHSAHVVRQCGKLMEQYWWGL